MTHRITLLPVAFATALLLLAGVAGAGGNEEGPPKWKAELVGRIHELRTKAEELRLRGSMEDAKHLLNKAAALEQVLELRRASTDAEERGHALRRDGREDEARAAMEESGRLWKKAEEKLRDVDAPRVLKAEDIERKIVALRERAAEEEEAGKEGAAAETRRQIQMLEKSLASRGKDGAARGRIEHLRQAARHLHEAGMPDLAERLEREANALAAAQAAAPAEPRPAEAPGARGISPNEADGLRREIQELRRQIDELRAALRGR